MACHRRIVAKLASVNSMSLLRPRIAIGLGLSAALAFSVAACGSSTGSQTSHTATVKALWFSGEGDSVKEGTAEVEIAVSVAERPTEFSLDLDTERDQGAGPSWTAATWSAASAATLFSFRDPRTLSISASIDGPINGPSAGGLMSATMLAMTAGVPMLPDTTMTGTINPDGSIGLVGGIPAKLRAAKAAGMKKVLIPSSGTISIDPKTGQPVKVLDEAKQLDLEVTPVSSIFEAMPLLTGRADALNKVGELPQIAKPVQESVAKSTKQLDRLTQQLVAKARKTKLPQEAIRQSTTGRAKALASLRADKVSDAYAQLWQVFYELDQQIVAEQTIASVKRNGQETVKQQLLQQISDLQSQSSERNDSVAATNATVIEQMVGLPDVLTWVGNPELSLGIYREYLNSDEVNDRSLVLVAQAVSEAKANIEVSLDQSLAALMASPGVPADPTEVSATLASYTGFLKQTGDASLNYYEQAVANLLTDPAKADHKKTTFDYAMADSMRSSLQNPASGDSPANQRQSLSTALSYYIATAQLTVETDVLEVQPLDPLDRNVMIANREGFKDAMAASSHLNNRLLRLMNKESVDSSYAQWMVQWGKWQTSQAGGDYPDSARLYGLTNTWQASLQLLLLNSDPIRDLSSSGTPRPS